MAYNKEVVRLARERIESNRSESENRYRDHQDEAISKIPEMGKILNDISMTAPRLLNEAAKGELDDARLEKIKGEVEKLNARKKELLVKAGFPEDFLQMKYVCGKCSDTGYVGLKRCVCLRREMAKIAVEKSGIGSLIKRQSFDNFSFEYYESESKVRMKKNFAYLKNFAEGFNENESRSWLLLGATGLGKTHLSTSVAGIVIEKGYYLLYDSMQNIALSYEKSRYFNNEEHEDKIKECLLCDLLIIDDLGAEVANQYSVAGLYNIINTRINNGKSTIINTNLSMSELRERYEDRITSRLFGEFQILLFDGKDIRGQILSKKAKGKNSL